MQNKSTAYNALCAAVERERAGHASWNRLFELAALEHAQDGEPPEWAQCVAMLCGFQLMPLGWRLEVGRSAEAATLTLHSPAGSTFCVVHSFETEHGNVIADFGRALSGTAAMRREATPTPGLEPKISGGAWVPDGTPDAATWLRIARLTLLDLTKSTHEGYPAYASELTRSAWRVYCNVKQAT